MYLRHFLLAFLILYTANGNAQPMPVQTVKGTVVDRSIKTVLQGATVELVGSSIATTTDANGNFRLEKIPVGRQSIKITYVGYKTITINNLSVEAGKQLELTIEMDEQVTIGTELIIQSKTNKARPINDLAMVSARMFSVEETRRFAAGINDPSRIAVGFAGVSSSGNDNALIIRGNAPNGLLWRMEGVDIPNPNHYARVGTSGGAISILSAQLLTNSDFMTGAFPAEYGNALSGVFDIRLRKGNKEKREHTFSISTVGVDAATEGYFKKGYGGSYLVNYRYGFLTLMQKLGLDVGDAPTSFQDLSFNINLPLNKLGNLSIFGFGGISNQKTTAFSDSITFTNQPNKRRGRLDASNTGAIGFVHTILLGKKTQLKTIYSINASTYKEEDNSYLKINGPLISSRNNQFSENNNILSIVATHKFSKHHLLKFGTYISFKHFDLHQREAVNNVLKDKVKSNGQTTLTNYFLQWKWDPVSRFSFQAGIHAQTLALNHSSVVEPRMGLKYKLSSKQFLSLGFGMHAQMQPLGNYFARIRVGNDTVMPNRQLGFSRASHYVLGYSIQLAANWNLKAELYYQWLYRIPVTAGKPTNYSVLNLEDDYAIEPLSNTGHAKNYGLELTLERWWNDQFYLLSTLSLYQSLYQASDKQWRSTRYNSNINYTFLAGREWALKGRRPSSLGIDLKLLCNGGQRVTPIDYYRSLTLKRTVFDLSRIYGQKLPAFFRADLQAEWKIQYRKATGSIIAGVQNLTNNRNAYNQSYNPVTKLIDQNYLMGIIPVMGVKVDM